MIYISSLFSFLFNETYEIEQDQNIFHVLKSIFHVSNITFYGDIYVSQIIYNIIIPKYEIDIKNCFNNILLQSYDNIIFNFFNFPFSMYFHKL